MNLKNTIIVLMLMMAQMAVAQDEKTAETDSLKHDIVAAYADSLRVLRHRIDSLETIQRSLNFRDTNRYSRLFTPLTFYSGLSHNRFSLDERASALSQDNLSVDNALINIYLYRPDLVKRTEREIESTKVVKVETKHEEIVAQHEVVAEVGATAEEAMVDMGDILITRPNFWTFSGNYELSMNQNYFSDNWYQGGENNYNGRTQLVLQANYNNKQHVLWENKLEVLVGLQTSKGDKEHKVRTTQNQLRYTGKLGLQATKKWYYTLQTVGTTQVLDAYPANQKVSTSSFLSPLNVNVSLGMDCKYTWFKKKMSGSVHIAPLAYNLKYVKRLDLSKRNGIDEGKHSKSDYGSTFQFDGNWKLSDNLSWQTRLYLYTTYERTEMQWENTFSIKVSRFITAKLYAYPRYDDSRKRDDKYGYFQLKEYTSLGFNYSF